MPLLDQVDVILHRPQASENIGSVARAMKNFGLHRLVLVSPLRYVAFKAEKLATGAVEILHEAVRVETLEQAIAPYALVIPTTERALAGRELPVSPREAARVLVERAQTGRVALLRSWAGTGGPSRSLRGSRIRRPGRLHRVPACLHRFDPRRTPCTPRPALDWSRPERAPPKGAQVREA